MGSDSLPIGIESNPPKYCNSQLLTDRPVLEEPAEEAGIVADWGAAQSPNLINVESANTLGAYIEQQVAAGIWSSSEAMGVRSLVETVSLAMSTPRLNTQLRSRLKRWRARLSELGIEVSMQLRHEKTRVRGGGHSQGGTQMQTATS